MGHKIQKITPFLWFDDRAEEAARFYTSIFRDAKTLSVARYERAGAEATLRPEGTDMTVAFHLEGHEFVGLNGGPVIPFSPAVSFVVNCATQAEIDELCAQLSAGGEAEMCGWLQDRYGVSWQIVPRGLAQMLQDPDARKTEEVMAALLTMRKLDLKALRDAYSR